MLKTVSEQKSPQGQFALWIIHAQVITLFLLSILIIFLLFVIIISYSSQDDSKYTIHVTEISCDLVGTTGSL